MIRHTQRACDEFVCDNKSQTLATVLSDFHPSSHRSTDLDLLGLDPLLEVSRVGCLAFSPMSTMDYRVITASKVYICVSRCSLYSKYNIYVHIHGKMRRLSACLSSYLSILYD